MKTTKNVCVISIWYKLTLFLNNEEQISTHSLFVFDEHKSYRNLRASVEASHDLKKWGEIGEVQGTGSSIKFTDWREAIFQKQYYRLRLAE